MHRLSAECGRSLLTWLCTLAVGPRSGGGFLPSYPHLVLQARLAPIPRLPIFVWIFSRYLTTFSLKLAGSRSASLHLATAVCSRSGIGMFWTLLRVIIGTICASHGTCGVAAVFCAILISS